MVLDANLSFFLVQVFVFIVGDGQRMLLSHDKCEPISIPLFKVLPYKWTIIPNGLKWPDSLKCEIFPDFLRADHMVSFPPQDPDNGQEKIEHF